MRHIFVPNGIMKPVVRGDDGRKCIMATNAPKRREPGFIPVWLLILLCLVGLVLLSVVIYRATGEEMPLRWCIEHNQQVPCEP